MNPHEDRGTGDDLDVDAILDGDPKAFEVLVRRETGRLYGLIVRIVQDQDEARSVLQETFLQAYEGLESFRGHSQLTTWLYGIALNQARTARRKRKREPAMSEEEVELLQPAFRMGMYRRRIESWTPENEAERRDRVDIVRRAIDQLPDEYREIILLRDMNELSTEETGTVLGLSKGAVRVRLHRARRALREILERHIRR
jgi:RNA polymerase sigma-70 factor, ECF subfamily